jgi:hypothetical protein
LKKLYRLIECCVNWRVAAGLGIVSAALFLLAPKLAIASLPVLAFLVCPVSMLFMMRSMRKMNMVGETPMEPAASSTLEYLSREEQVQLVEEQLRRVQLQQRAIRNQLPADIKVGT